MLASRLICCLVAALCFAPITSAFASPYVIENLGTLGGGISEGLGLNNRGEVVGQSQRPDQHQNAFLYNGAIRQLTRDSYSSASYAINDNGVVMGSIYEPGWPGYAFVYDGSTYEYFESPFSNRIRIMAINDHGQATGYVERYSLLYEVYFDGTSIQRRPNDSSTQSLGTDINNHGTVAGSASPTFHAPLQAFISDGATRQFLGTLGGLRSEAFGINDAGLVVGYSLLADQSKQAFRYDGTMHGIGTLGGNNSTARGVNEAGQIVGEADLADGQSHAFLYDPLLGMIDLNSLIDPQSGWILTEARAINDRGQVAGTGLFQGVKRGFLLTPVPEPSSGALAALGLSMLAVFWKRRIKAGRFARAQI